MDPALQSLIAENGAVVDKELIAAIWAEHGEASCRDIVRILAGAESCDGSATADGETASTTWSEPLSSRSESSAAADVGHSHRAKALPADYAVEPIATPEALTEFLVACFPECGHDYLATRVQEMFCSRGSTAFPVDPVEAITMVGSAFECDLDAVEGQQYRQQARAGPAANLRDTSLAAIQAQYAVPRSKAKPRSRTKPPKSSKPRTRPSATRAPLVAASGNAWDAIGTEVDFLCKAFPMLAVSTVHSTYHACGADSDRAVAELDGLVAARNKPRQPPRNPVANIPSQSPSQSQSPAAVVRMVEVLRTLFPNHPVAALEQAAAESANADVAAERILEFGDVAVPQEPRRKPKWLPADSLVRHHVQPTAHARVGDIDDGPPERASLSDLSESAREWVTAHPTDPAVCRRRAAAEVERRNELYTKAAQAYARRHSLGQSGSTALYYSTEAQKHDERARVWRMRAAHASVAAIRDKDASIVDLHGLTSAEAVAVVKDALTARLADAAAGVAAATQPLHIVTGLGNHSVGRRARIYPSVLATLRSGGWRFVEGDGFIDLLS
ncbi:hypothetical protein H4R19_001258 [Coemansia spiralis]|nr:hypothetical protein H4R19_001258 [Coemansia spiralis]